jgi:hypothetical protein
VRELVLSSARGSNIPHKTLELGEGERRKPNNVDVVVAAVLPRMKLGACPPILMLLTRDGSGERVLPGDPGPLAIRLEVAVKAAVVTVMPAPMVTMPFQTCSEQHDQPTHRTPARGRDTSGYWESAEHAVRPVLYTNSPPWAKPYGLYAWLICVYAWP